MHWLDDEMLAAMIHQVIAAGIGRCGGCTLPLTDPDDHHAATVCFDCGELELWHYNCASPEVRDRAAATTRRVNWRWN